MKSPFRVFNIKKIKKGFKYLTIPQKVIGILLFPSICLIWWIWDMWKDHNAVADKPQEVKE